MVTISAKGTAAQTPSTANQIGKISRLSTMKTKVLINEIMADILPLDRAVNKADAKILMPANRKLIENILNPFLAISCTLVPLAVKTVISCDENIVDIEYINREQTSTKPIQIL